MARTLLRQFLAVVKAVLLYSKRLAKDTWIRISRKPVLFCKILCTILRLAISKGYDPRKPGATTTPDNQIFPGLKKPTVNGDAHDEQTIPLDSSISCSRYVDTHFSHGSLPLVLGAAPSIRSISMSSSDASRSDLAHISESEREAQSVTSGSNAPDHPLSHTAARGHRSLSAPQLREPESIGIGNNSCADDMVGADSVTWSTPPSTHENTRWAQLSNDRIFPLAPEFFQRYDRVAFAKDEETQVTIPALTLDFRDEPDPPGWKPILHPEGVLYFYNESKKAITDANLYDEQYYEQANQSLAIIERHVHSNGIPLPPSYTLALDINPSQSRTSLLTDYYFADHDRKVVFFLDDLDAGVNLPVWNHMKGVTSLNHIRHELEAQYWMHGALYPSTISVTSERISEVRDAILYYIGDLHTSGSSTSPYDLEDLSTFLGHVDHIEKNTGSYQGAASLLSRMYLVVSRQRFYDWHGVPQARVFRDRSVHYQSRWQKTWLIRIFSPLFFSAPDVHLNLLKKMWVDSTLYQTVLRDSIKIMSEEWHDYILSATVLLNANVAFLAIQSVDTHGGDAEKAIDYRSPTQVSCYLSIAFSIGSVIIGLLLLRQTRIAAMAVVNRLLRARSQPKLGLETLAILWSAPYALLLWAMISFLAAFASNCFTNSNIGSRLIIAIAWVALAILVLWCIWAGWLSNDSGYKAKETSEIAAAGVSIEVANPGTSAAMEEQGSAHAGEERRAASNIGAIRWILNRPAMLMLAGAWRRILGPARAATQSLALGVI